MSFSTPELSLQETLRRARELGYDGIEPRVGRNHGHGIELERTPQERRAIFREAADAGVAICCLALSTKYSDPDTVEAMIEETHRYIELAAAIGSPRLRVFGGVFPEGVDREMAIDTVAYGLASTAPAAAAAGVTLCLETHDAWTHPGPVAEVMRRVGHPNAAVNWDVMHPFRTSRIPMREAFETLEPWIRHVHIHDGTLSDPLAIKPCGEGEIDLRGAVESLLKAGYDGFVSGEWIGCEEIIDLSDELRRMRALEAKARGE